jgi:hypothetical protein
LSRWKALPARRAEVPVSVHATDFRRPSGAAFETFPRRSGSFPAATVEGFLSARVGACRKRTLVV